MRRHTHSILHVGLVLGGLAFAHSAEARDPQHHGARADARPAHARTADARTADARTADARTADARARDDKGPRAEMRARVREKMATFLTEELARRAGLDAGKTEKLGAAVRTQMERRQAHRQEMKQQMKALQALLDNKASDADVRAQLDKVLALADRDERIKAFVEETRAFLSAQEQARVAVAFPAVMREVQGMMREARKGSGPHGGRFDDGLDDRAGDDVED